MGKPRSELFGIPASRLAAICKVDISTARRWKRGEICPPETALMIITRDLGCFAPEWRGWTVNGEDLVAPSGWCVNRNDALIVPLLHGQIAALKSELGALKEEAEQMDEQPEPGEIPTISNTA